MHSYIASKDAYVLAELLTHPLGYKHPEAALRAYSRVRRAFTSNIVRNSRHLGFLYSMRNFNLGRLHIVNESEGRLGSVGSQNIQECFSVVEFGRKLKSYFDWFEDDAEHEPVQAIQMLERLVN
jgi:hypothetical protein